MPRLETLQRERQRRHRNRPPLRLLATAAATTLLLLGTAITAGEPPGADASRPDASWKDSPQGQALLERADEIVTLTKTFRGVGATEPIQKGLMLRDELRAVLLQKFEEQNDDGAVEKEFKVLSRLGLVDPNLDYDRFLLDLLTEQIAGFYDDETRELYILEGQDEATLDSVMSHELFHAIQDQTWSIARVRGPEDAHADLALARVALIEGDASAVMLDFELSPDGASFTDLPAALIRGASNIAAGASGSDVMDSAPFIVQQSLIFPYIEGMLFVGAIKKKGGWQGVDAVYNDPPMSTEQIMHPERYLERDEPVAVDFAVPDTLSESHQLVYDEVHGELGVLLYLKQHLLELGGDPQAAHAAAAGWDGDRSRLFESPDGQRLFVQLLALDSVEDAVELAEALDEVARLRYPGARHTELAGAGRGSALFTGDEYLWVEQRGSEVLFVEGMTAHQTASAPAELRGLTDTIWLTRTWSAYPTFAQELERMAGNAADAPAP